LFSEPVTIIALVKQLQEAMFSLQELRITLRLSAKWIAIGSGVGILAGIASAIFLTTLAWATNFRLEHPYLLFLLPLAGLSIGWIYHRFAGTAARGNNLIIDEIHLNREAIPLKMAPPEPESSANVR
jgi:H+/Cl- antiporter ClcA